MDTGLVLQLRRALVLIETDLARLGDVLAAQAQRYATTPMAGRTWLQHATPVTLGVKIAGWLGAVTRSRQRLTELRPRLLVLQFGGASGTLAALGEQALPVAEALAAELQLTLPEQPWHTQRDRLVEFASVLGLIAGSLGKLGRDISLLMQTEAAEVFEPSAPGKGGSSTMPHKRNPVGAAVLISAATRVPGLVSTMFSAMPQEHERSLGLWHAEWETLPEICRLVSGALQQAVQVSEGLEVDPERMKQNLDPGPGPGRSCQHRACPTPGPRNRAPFAGAVLQASSRRRAPSTRRIGRRTAGQRRAVRPRTRPSARPGPLSGPGAHLGYPCCHRTF